MGRVTDDTLERRITSYTTRTASQAKHSTFPFLPLPPLSKITNPPCSQWKAHAGVGQDVWYEGREEGDSWVLLKGEFGRGGVWDEVGGRSGRGAKVVIHIIRNILESARGERTDR
jgi:hypothetical protein